MPRVELRESVDSHGPLRCSSGFFMVSALPEPSLDPTGSCYEGRQATSHGAELRDLWVEFVKLEIDIACKLGGQDEKKKTAKDRKEIKREKKWGKEIKKLEAKARRQD